MDRPELYQFLVSVLLVLAGLVFGRVIEWRHYASIRRREKDLKDVLVFSVRRPPPDAGETRLVQGSVVLSDDAFTALWSSLRSLIGGRIRPYERIIDRARREAILRLKTRARELGAPMVFNIKFEQTSIADNSSTSALGALELHAYGTAIIPKRGSLP